ncbi:GNAT family N-acetyltransferase [Halobacillus halophilus]|uniref:GNAT family N-acetyltransferase n=1 Tax=Halobacillus halophilus TaxID=1570 RepID=UPI001CD2F5DF|nr:GNAT family N-acetyltransferase [Halobacillus halophilus]MCA1011495.1 GNAT family N-acetyltransferase [Halobacillus halophilus]
MKIYQLKVQDINPAMLDSFERYQKTDRVLVNCNEGLFEKPDHFEDNWSICQKREIVRHFSNVSANGGSVHLVEDSKEIIGFAVIESVEFGESAVYRELSYFHIDQKHRGRGIGKELFQKVRKVAKELGAEKLYIGAHPSIETQDFYMKRGCSLAEEINREIYEREPRDWQLEIKL